MFRNNIVAILGRVSVLASQVICIGIFSRHWKAEYISLFALFFSIYQVSPVIDLGLGFGVKQTLIEMLHGNVSEDKQESMLNASLSLLLYFSGTIFSVMTLVGGFLYFFSNFSIFSIERSIIFSIGFFVLVSICVFIPTSMSNHIYFAYPNYYIKITFDIVISLTMVLSTLLLSKLHWSVALPSFFRPFLRLLLRLNK